MRLRLFALALSVSALTGCGGAMPELTQQSSQNAVSSARHVDAPLIVTWLPCAALSPVPTAAGSTDPRLQGLQACGANGASFATLVKFRGPASLQGARLCLLPYNDASTFTETCFAFSGDQDFSLNSSGFHSVAVVLETDLASFKGYLNGTGAQRPPYAAARLR
ncbi:MAG: hypothetical protein HUU37_03780 [Bdellovibrionales bacterium]|nr:hypothetical protein [Bdellovibrionales bacterium]